MVQVKETRRPVGRNKGVVVIGIREALLLKKTGRVGLYLQCMSPDV